jgi:predicted permease
MRTSFSRLIDVWWRRSRDARLDEEVRAHLDLLADEFVAKGMTREDARLAARKAFGGVDQMKERYRDQRGFPLIDELMQDVRYAMRLMLRERWFTAATVVALSLGIGATATMVTLLYSMHFRGLPFPEAHSLVGVTGEATRSQGGQIPFAVFEAFRSAAGAFEALSAEVDAPINLGDETHAADQFGGTYLSVNAFTLLRVRPILGRDFLPADDRPGAPAVAIIGYRIWTDRYGSDPSAIGRTVRLNGETATIVGVMPKEFAYPIETQVWRPLTAFPALNAPGAGHRPIRIVGRLARGVTPEQARAELSALVSTLTTVPAADRTRRIIIMPLNETYVGRATQPVPMMMLAAVTVVLLIACSHAASLLLARSSARARELSMRAALGAGRGRLVRQLLVESVMLSLLAGLLGVSIAARFIGAFANEVSGFGLPYWTRFTFDLPLAAVITAICIAAGLIFGILPALHQSRANLNEVLNQFGRTGVTSPKSRRATTVLLTAELAVTVILLAAATALVRSADGVYRADAVIDLSNVWEFRVTLPQAKYSAVESRRAFFNALEQRLAAAPGMQSAALASAPPFNARDSRGVVMDDGAIPEPDALRSARFVAIGPRYFDTLELKVVRGRALDDVEPGLRLSSVLVNERFVEGFSPGADPVGRELLLINERAPNAPPERFTIVGIAPPLRQQVAAGHTPVVYAPFASQSAATASLIVRGRPEQFADVLRREVRRLDPDLPLFNLQSLERVSYNSRWIQRITSTAFSVVAIIAIVLSAVGLYSLTAYAAVQRTHEVGVRMALGARRSQVLWLFLKQAMRNVAIGLALGLAGAVPVGFALQGALVEVSANHPLALAGVSIFVISVSLAAAVLPARRAAGLDPVAALRQE